jgi:hypothetical protein
MHTEISNETHHSVKTDNNHNTCDTDDEDPRPAKRRKLPPTPTDNALTPPDEPTPVDNDHYHTLRTSQSPSITVESAPVAEYQEWPFQGFLKRVKIGNETTYNLEFKLPSISEHLHLPTDPNALDINHDATEHSQIHQGPLKPKKSKVSWVEDDIKLAQMWNEGRSWEYIFTKLPHRSKGSIRVRCSTKFQKRPRTGAGRS